MADPHPDEPPDRLEPAGRDPVAGPGPFPVAYQPKVEPVSRFETVRGLRYHLRVWKTGAKEESASSAEVLEAGAPILLMLHGWMDVSASFQFMVDALEGHWQVIAPDWRGFGLSEACPGSDRTDSYAFADYLGDLDALVDRLSPVEPVRLVAHSMGGNVAMLYAGIRPHRVAGLVNLEGFGLAGTEPAKAVGRYRRWLDELKQPASFRPFPSLEAVADRLMRTNPRLPADKARYLAGQWAQPLQDRDQGSEARYVLQADPAHKRINPVPYRVDEALSCWAAAEAPILWVASKDRGPHHEYTKTDDYRRRLSVIRRLGEVEVADAGHMLHHDQPGLIARLVEEFFSR